MENVIKCILLTFDRRAGLNWSCIGGVSFRGKKKREEGTDHQDKKERLSNRWQIRPQTQQHNCKLGMGGKHKTCGVWVEGTFFVFVFVQRKKLKKIWKHHAYSFFAPPISKWAVRFKQTWCCIVQTLHLRRNATLRVVLTFLWKTGFFWPPKPCCLRS